MDEFNKIIKQRLENYQSTPPKELFDRVRNNYPKSKSFINRYKYYFISSLIVLTGIITTIYLLNSKPYHSEIIENNKPIKIIENNISEDHIIVAKETSNLNNNNQKIVKLQSTKLNTFTDEQPVKKYSNTIIFSTKSVEVCGKTYELEFNGKIQAIQLPKNISIEKDLNRLVFTAKNFGNYIIYYVDDANSEIIKDSVSINFKNSQVAKVHFSNEKLCTGEDLILSFENSNSTPIWDNNNFKINRISKSTYNISNLSTGENEISFKINENGCEQLFSKTIQLLKPLEYSVLTISDVCSKSNASLTVSGDKTRIDYFSLNNSIENKTGLFTGLNSGIYYLNIKYDKSCFVSDTLLVQDSLNIIPYFIAERDLINKNKYQFINLSRVDDRGYEINSLIKFDWKVDNEILSTKDNFDYEFSSGGKHKVELIASLSENCQNIYSETLEIAEVNFRVPNIFTPNGDGIGDEFKIVFDGELVWYRIDIANRVGEVIFESSNINKSWDGKINGNDDALDGTYYYIIKGEDYSGNRIERRGSLRLTRH